MAAYINGYTIHHWSGIPTRPKHGRNTGDRHKQSIKCQALRVVILDAISMDSAELLGALEYVIRKATRGNGTYKKRSDGTTRAFGGANIVMCGDFWQLRPVNGTWLCSDPDEIEAGTAKDAMRLFWDEGVDTIRNVWILTQLVRCKDDWYNSFLRACRNGTLSLETYCFIHGLPTARAAGDNCKCNEDCVYDEALETSYKKSWADAFMNGCTDMVTLIAQTECEQCRTKRQERKRVLDHNIRAERVPPPNCTNIHLQKPQLCIASMYPSS